MLCKVCIKIFASKSEGWLKKVVPNKFKGIPMMFLGSFISIPLLFQPREGPIRFCHFQEKTKSWTFYLCLKECIWRRLKIRGCSLVVEEPLWYFSLHVMPSFKYKSNFSDFVFLAEWQNLIGPFPVLCINIKHGGGAWSKILGKNIHLLSKLPSVLSF